MTTKSLSSTKAQNNFGRVLDDVTHNHTRYVIERRGVPQVIILSFDDFAHILSDEEERQQMAEQMAQMQAAQMAMQAGEVAGE